MKPADAIALIRSAITEVSPQSWADLGSGDGTFTHALQTILPHGSHIIPIDKRAQRLPNFILADFEQDNLALTDLDGILLANSLHYIKDKPKLIRKLETYFTKDPTFLIVEYDTDQTNTWVPYPIPFNELEKLFRGLGYQTIQKLAQHRSVYNKAYLYTALIKK
jgi:ubiquinone/menaquinone biosynthesis C-methylase UbiE